MKGIGIQLNDSNDNGQIMDIKIDPVRDAEGKILRGLVVGSTLEQNKALILISQPGEIKFMPELGVGIGDMILSSEFLEYRHRVREHFAKDGLKIEVLQIYENKPFKVVANYG